LRILPHITASRFGDSISWETMAVDAGPPQPVDGRDRDNRNARRALWIAGAGIVAGLATAIVFALGDLSAKGAIILGVPIAILTIGGVIFALASDPARAERQGFRAGMRAGAIRNRLRSLFGRRGSGRS
jgi:hypothetical protein